MNISENNKAFEEIYITYYSKMKRFAKEYVLSDEDAENIVQDIFTDLWQRWDVLSSHKNLFAFLFLSVKNRSIDFLRHQITIKKAEDSIIEEYKLNYDALDDLGHDFVSENDLMILINKALDSLPEKCKIIFLKNKIEGKKQKEIALELNISIKTVENQISIAYKKLKNELGKLRPLLLFLFY